MESLQEFSQYLINGLSIGSIYALIALGYTMVYGILQMINFAHSEVYMIGAFGAYFCARFLGIQDTPGYSHLVLLLVVAMSLCAALGVTIERLAYRPLRNAPKLNILITAIGVSLFLQYFGQIVFGADPKVFPNVIEDATLLSWGQTDLRSLDVSIFLISIMFMLILNFLVFHTKVGRAMRAVSMQPNTARLMGINVSWIITMTFIIGSSLAGVGAVLIGMRYPKIDPLMGSLIGLKAFVAAVLGGIGNIYGAVLGGILIGLSEEMVVAYLSSTYRDALSFLILIIILLIKPSGLLGSTVQEKV